MKVVLRVKSGYLNIGDGIKIYKHNENATKIPISQVSSRKEKIYKERPMIGEIKIEVVDK